MGNEQLKYRFLDTCHSGLYDAWDDYTRWDTPGSCTVGMMASNYRCPTANCDGLTGTWEGLEYKYATYDDDGYFGRAIFDCVDCSCAVNSVTSCNAYDEDELSADACSRETLLCSVGDEWGDLDPISCNVGDGESYCGWSEFKAIDGFDPDRVCIESYIENGPEWECMDAYICEAFYGKDELEDSSKGLCAAQQMSFTVASYDCIDYKWVSETYTFDGNHMCCTGSNECNEQDVSATALGDSNTCSSNSRISTYYKVMFECMYGDKGLGNNDFSKYSQCSVPLPEDKYDVCDLLEPYWKQGTFCSCRAMQVIEKMYPSDDYHDGLREQLQLAFDSTYASTKATLEMWNEDYDCGKTFQCDITADDGVDQVDAPITDDEVDYDWSYSPYSGDLDQEECVFSGSVSNTNSDLCQKRTISRYDFKMDNDLSWKALTKACPGLVYGGCADPTWGSDHSMADELEWASCGDCPRCPCDRNQPDTYYIKNYTQFAPPFEVKVCYECSCNEYIADDNIYALYCYPESTFNSPEELKDVQCPYTTPAPTPAPTGGCDNGAGIIYPPGSYFFYYDADKCETYCTCNIENERECETGWSNIMGNEQLKYRFLDTCHSGLYDAWDDYTRWDTPGSCTVGMMASNYRCPTANCDGLTGTWEGLEYK
eukprot:416929_1